MGIRGQKVDVLNVDGKHSQSLDGIHAKQNPAFPQLATDGVDIDPPSADKMAGGQCHEGGVLIDLTQHIHVTNSSEMPNIQQPDFNPLFGQCHPWVDVGRVIVVIDDDVGGAAELQSGGDETQSQRGWANESHFAHVRSRSVLPRPVGFP